MLLASSQLLLAALTASHSVVEGKGINVNQSQTAAAMMTMIEMIDCQRITNETLR
jgi:hypothetical protein